MKIEELRATVAALECRLVRAELEACGWNQSKTARALGCGLTTLRRMIERHPSLSGALEHLGLPQGRPAEAPE